MINPQSQYRARVSQQDCHYCKGSGFIPMHYNEGPLIKTRQVKCHHIVGDPLNTETRAEFA